MNVMQAGISEVENNLKTIKMRIKEAAASCGRNPETVKLLAVSKTVPADRIKQAIYAGVTRLGENYIQEAREKIKILADHPVTWHFIGHLQSNKAKYAVRLFDLIHSVDSLNLAHELNKQAKKINKIQNILIQVNTGMEPTKSGVSITDARNLIKEVSLLENLSIKGLMTMPPFFNDPEKVRPYYSALRELGDSIKKESIPNVIMDELSMGMTGDFEAAIKEGATIVRIGTAIFGKRE